MIIDGDMTDDGDGQVATPGEGSQLRQFSQRYQQGIGPDRIHFPVYTGLGNHDLDQDGPPPHVDWYRRELRDYVELNHRTTVFFKPPVPVLNYDVASDSHSWDWGGLHLVQAHRFAGDTTKGAISGLPWLKNDLATYAADGRPVVLFQHYGWDQFSTERWDPVRRTFDDDGSVTPHWWSDAERQALQSLLAQNNVIGIFHGHQHETAMVYQHSGLDLFKPKAAFMGGFAVVHVTDDYLDVVFAEAVGGDGEVKFTNAFSKRLGSPVLTRCSACRLSSCEGAVPWDRSRGPTRPRSACSRPTSCTTGRELEHPPTKRSTPSKHRMQIALHQVFRGSPI